MKFSTTILCVAFIINVGWAQDTHTETNTNLGIEFSHPTTWTLTPKVDGYLLGSTRLEGFILIRVQSYKTLKKMKAAMQNGIAQEDGNLLTLLNELQPFGENGLAGMYEGMVDEQKVRGFMMAKLDTKNGKGAITIVLAPETRFNQSHMDALKIIARSLKFL